MAALEAIVLSFVLADERTMQLLVTSLCLVAALLVAAVVVALVNRWRRQRDVKDDLSPNAQLAHFRSLYEAGTISAEEFERLRAVLSARMRESLGVPAAAGLQSRQPSAPETPSSDKPEAPPPQTGIQRPPDGPDTGVRPA
ncbi:MAG TPA: SHOCT domain-containing protein [Gemmataceae bacterium]|nr:SHOCT domain-containing protein [Gemmataceae bacterium]